MPLGDATIAADEQCAQLRTALGEYLGLTTADETHDVDILVSARPPLTAASHVVIDGPLTDEIDAWDAALPAQTVAGALWLVPGQPEPTSAAIAWLLLRLQHPATPLSDLTDTNGRSLRWSVCAGIRVDLPAPAPPDVDPDEIKAWVDAQPEVADLGQSVERLGGDTAPAVLASVQRFNNAVQAAGGRAALGAFDAAVAEHLAQVQRSGFGRWRSGKARAASAAALHEAGRTVAAEQIGAMLDARAQSVAAEAVLQADHEIHDQVIERLVAALDGLALPAEPDFDQVPRSWTTGAPRPRRYVFVADDAVEGLAELPATVRGCPQVPAGTAVCALMQSGFSLPGVR